MWCPGWCVHLPSDLVCRGEVFTGEAIYKLIRLSMRRAYALCLNLCARIGNAWLPRSPLRPFPVFFLHYENCKEKLEEDNLLDWRPMDLINLSRVLTESYSAIKKARSSVRSDLRSVVRS